MFFFSAHGARSFSQVACPDGAFLIFGRESCGLPEEILRAYPDRTLRIPMLPDRRCLNLSNAVAVAAYEVFRQWGYEGFV